MFFELFFTLEKILDLKQKKLKNLCFLSNFFANLALKTTLAGL